MAEEELNIVRLRTDFYRDGFSKLLLACISIIISIFFLIAISVYFYLEKPLPVYFETDNDWRILPPVPLDQPYLTTADLIQWVSEILPTSFAYDFVNYSKQLKDHQSYFTENGWKIFLGQVNIYANSNDVLSSKLFINTSAAGAPFILNQGILEGKYSWWVQMPINLNYITNEGNKVVPLVIQALVTRISTLNNLNGVAIENMIVTKGTGEQVRVNG